MLVLSCVGPSPAVARAALEEPLPPVNTVAPAISGTPTYAVTLTASTGTWEPADATYSFQWLRNGSEVAGATAATYTLQLGDLGTRFSVRVTATRDGLSHAATSAETTPVDRARFALVTRPAITGTQRYLQTLTATAGTWSPAPAKVALQWFRDGVAIRGATARTYKLTHLDVGRRIDVKVLAQRVGFHYGWEGSFRTGAIGHRVPTRHIVSYTVTTRGRITASLAEFRKQANATLNDPRGWRSAGVGFREVSSGGTMTLVLSEASRVPSFSSSCSAQWSCRVGRYVVINQTRWLYASDAWRNHRGTIRDYRHLVVNHETGHWLGHGHRGCPSAGALAPVMQQQSKSLGGCRINPWPTPREWFAPRF